MQYSDPKEEATILASRMRRTPFPTQMAPALPPCSQLRTPPPTNSTVLAP